MKENMNEDIGKVIINIQELLLEIGIPANVLGFTYIVYAVHLVLVNNDRNYRMIKQLYIETAQHFNTSLQSVERCMRTAIATGIENGRSDLVEQIFKNSINPKKGVPTNSQFITSLCLYIARQETQINQ